MSTDPVKEEPPATGPYEAEAAGMRELAEIWDVLAYRCGDPTLTSSPCAQEAAVLPSAIAEPEQLTRAVANDSALYVTAAAQQLRALVGLLGPEIVLTGWSVTRTLAEHCGRVAWLLSPDATPTGRVARYYMEWVVSVHMAKNAANGIRDRAREKQLRQEREAILSQARTVFPDVTMFTSEDLNSWTVGREPYAGLSRAVNTFGRRQLNARGLYDTLSSFTHPSLYQLSAQTETTQLQDRVHHAFVVQPEVLRWQLATASACVYRAAHYVVAYLELDPALLEDWADRNPDLLGWTRETDRE